MNNTNRETQCTRCIHRDVCLHKSDFLDICTAIFDATVTKSSGDGKCNMKKVINYDCLSDIEVKCRYYKQEVATTR